MNTIASEIINDEQSLVSASSRFGHPVPVYDDGFGPLFIHRDSMGITGIVRAKTWEDAYSICEDEFFPSGDADACEEMARIDAMEDDSPEQDYARLCWGECYGCRNNPRRMPDGSVSSIYAKDLNGDSLDLLTPALIESLGITLVIETNS